MMNQVNMNQQLNQLSAQLELQTQQTNQIKNEFVNFSQDYETQMEQFKGDLQEIKDVHYHTKTSDLKTLKIRLDQLEIEVHNTMKGKIVISVTEKIIQSQSFLQTIEQLIQEKALPAIDNRIKQFSAQFSQKISTLAMDIINSGQSQRYLEQQFNIVQSKVGIVDNLMGFIETHKQETEDYLKQIFLALQDKVDRTLQIFAEDLEKVQFDLIEIQKQGLDQQLKEQQQTIDQIKKDIVPLINQLNLNERVIEQLKYEFESQIKDANKKNISQLGTYGNIPNSSDLFEKFLQNNSQTHRSLAMAECRLNFNTNIAQVEKFLVEEKKQIVQKDFEIEKAYFYSDLFKQMIERVDQLKSLFERCHQDMQFQIQQQSPPVTCFFRPTILNVSKQITIKSISEGRVGRQKIKRPHTQATSRILFENMDIPPVYSSTRRSQR